MRVIGLGFELARKGKQLGSHFGASCALTHARVRCVLEPMRHRSHNMTNNEIDNPYAINHMQIIQINQKPHKHI